jgi:catechol 2,3-dioxygenase-like lactoylglutathione lyase family enzyme
VGQALDHAVVEQRGIDHVVIAVRNLEETGDFYRRLGFQVGTRNQHPWGTENRLIQFGSSFIELITIGENAHLVPPQETRRFSFGAFIRDYLQQREGLAMLALSSNNAQRDAALFAESGIGDFESFSFERNGVKPDGATTRVAFSLAFARDSQAPDAGFFVCQQHLPENFWDRRLQRHANHASNITAVGFTTAAPERHRTFFTAFTGEEKQKRLSGEYRFALNGGRIELLHDGQARQPRLTSFTVQVNDLPAMASRLAAEKIPFTDSENRPLIAKISAFGADIHFEDASATGHGHTRTWKGTLPGLDS